ncbi:hypothetical protein [Psychromonas sp. Urea-02u-13]|uniref:hypothetical protein n=1 Tax=Psychromonas sp. Urea-02u-13 TaxID=2058326 RepID=UPI000C31ED2F|nr:hypothetical protein [Psychromonas sp. Urea-02u-13]PKG37719.1 hypothetical protein CXF74_17445 [Psychromonas sp. Urea-02u-13]
MNNIISALIMFISHHKVAVGKDQKKLWHGQIKCLVNNTHLLKTPGVSVKAAAKAVELGIKGSLHDYKWEQIKGPNRKILHLEHNLPVSQISRMLEELEDVTEESVGDIMDLATTAWLIKEEDELLTVHGFRTNRPMNAYQVCGIELL